MSDTYNALVVGSGPSGIAVVGNLLEKDPTSKILWVDPQFQGGRISRHYHEVSSNTKVARILDFARAVVPFKRIIQNTPRPNAITELESLNKDEGCALVHAADMFAMLTDGLLQLPNIKPFLGTVSTSDYSPKSRCWFTTIQSETSCQTICHKSLIFCTGSSPSAFAMRLPNFTYQKIELDSALSPSKLKTSLRTNEGITVGVIGSSHSAVTVLMNLANLANTTHANLRVKWFTRRPLIYAVFMDGWILHDNTGLKGIAADFARANLEDSVFSQSSVNKFLARIDCSEDSEQPYEKNLPGCTHIVQAVGFVRDPLPHLTRDGSLLEGVVYNHKTGGFADRAGSSIDGLYGAGIAFPEQVTDPAGNTEMAVGFWKFMQYLKRVVPTWNTQ